MGQASINLIEKGRAGIMKRSLLVIWILLFCAMLGQELFSWRKTAYADLDEGKEKLSFASGGECKEHIELHSATHTANEFGDGRSEMYVLQNYKINLWPHHPPYNWGPEFMVAGKMIPGSRAIIFEKYYDKNKLGFDVSYKVQSPFDNSIGWVNKVQVARTLFLNTKTNEACIPDTVKEETYKANDESNKTAKTKGIASTESTKKRISKVHEIGTTIILQYPSGVNIYKDMKSKTVVCHVPSMTQVEIIDSVIKKNSFDPNLYKVKVMNNGQECIGWVTAYVVYGMNNEVEND